jgi:hypothetical protein
MFLSHAVNSSSSFLIMNHVTQLYIRAGCNFVLLTILQLHLQRGCKPLCHLLSADIILISSCVSFYPVNKIHRWP